MDLFQLLEAMASQDGDRSNAAVLQLLQWLERGRHGDAADRGARAPSADELVAVVDAIFATFAAHPRRGHVLSLLAETPPAIALERLLKLITGRWSSLDHHARHQAFVGLRDLLACDDQGRPERALRRIVEAHDPRPNLVDLHNSRDPSARNIAKIMLCQVRRYLADN